MKKISEVMEREVRLTSPNQTIREAAATMAMADIGSLPVGENDRLVGIVTDRDIVMRAIAKGRDASTPVREVMTDRIQYCFEDDDVTKVAEDMASLGVRRLAVLNKEKRLVGIVSLSNVTSAGNGKATGRLLKGVAEPHHAHA
jgi:CBS domain-containing protein